MAYLDPTNLHTLSAQQQTRAIPEPSSILFPTGPQWSRRYQRSKTSIDKPYLYTDQGPPMYRLLGRHCCVFQLPVKTDYHLPARSYHFELRQYNRPTHRSRSHFWGLDPISEVCRNGALTFAPGPPPPQVAMYDGLASGRHFDDTKNATWEVPGKTMKSLQAWDKYRYLPGPPSETIIYNNVQDMQLPLV